METYKFKTVEQLERACRRWYALSKTERAKAIVKKNNLRDASEIWMRHSNGKCYAEHAFTAEYDDVRISFGYWGTIFIGKYQINSVEQVKDLGEMLSDDDEAWHDDCDQWELDYAEGSDEDRATADADWYEFCEMHNLPYC